MVGRCPIQGTLVKTGFSILGIKVVIIKQVAANLMAKRGRRRAIRALNELNF